VLLNEKWAGKWVYSVFFDILNMIRRAIKKAGRVGLPYQEVWD
jgi:hypothetical protein